MTLLLITGLAFAQTTNSRTFEEPYDSVWSAVVEALSDGGLPVKYIDKDSGLITTEFVRFGDVVTFSFSNDRLKQISL